MQSLSRREFSRAVGFVGLCSILLTAIAARGATVVWSGGSLIDSSLEDTDNWVGGVLPTAADDVVFTGSVRTDPYTTGVFPTYNTVAFDENASAFTIGGSDALTIGGFANAIVNNSAATQTFAVPVILSGAGTTNTEIRATSGDLVFGDLTIGNSSSTRSRATPGTSIGYCIARNRPACALSHAGSESRSTPSRVTDPSVTS